MADVTFIVGPVVVEVGRDREYRVEGADPEDHYSWFGEFDTKFVSENGQKLRAEFVSLGQHRMWLQKVGESFAIDWIVFAMPAAATSSGPPTSDEYGIGEGPPQLVFIESVPQRDDFLESAFKFHKTWDLEIKKVHSVADIVRILAKRGGIMTRVRIVTHGIGADEVTPIAELRLPLFRRAGDATGLLKEELRAWAVSDGSGLSHLLVSRGLKNLQKPNEDFLNLLLNEIKATTAVDEALSEFGISESLAPEGKPLIREFVLRSIDLRVLTHPAQVLEDPAQAIRIKDAIMMILEDLRNRLSEELPGATNVPGKALTIQNAIVAANVQGSTVTFPKREDDDIKDIAAAVSALKSGFRKNLESARQCFLKTSWIDIRGCLAGKDMDYLAAVSEFFGMQIGDLHIQPCVSAPDLLIKFPDPKEQPIVDLHVSVTTLLSGNTQPATELEHWIKVVKLSITGTPTLEQKAEAYLDSNFVLPVPVGVVDETFDLHYLNFERARKKWLMSQWNPPLAKTAAKLEKKWAKTNKAPQLSALLGDFGDLSGLFTLATVPDTRYDEHIKKFLPGH